MLIGQGGLHKGSLSFDPRAIRMEGTLDELESLRIDDGLSFVPCKLFIPPTYEEPTVLCQLHPFSVEIEQVSLLEKDTPAPIPASTCADNSVPDPPIQPTATNPLLVPMCEFRRLTSSRNAKQINLVGFLCDRERWKCEPGDAFGIFCENDPIVVTEFLKLVNLSPSMAIRVKPLVPIAKASLVEAIANRPLSLQTLCSRHLDLMHFPKKAFLRHLAEYCEEEEEKRALLHLCSKAGSADYMKLAAGHACIVDFLYTFPSCHPPLQCLLSYLPPLQPRFYSVCSDCSSSRVEFLYGDMIYSTAEPHRLLRQGLCTSWLDRCGKRWTEGQPVHLSIFPRPSPHFRLPSDPKVPMVMICAGTGVSPFIGFLRSIWQSGIRRGMTWLFYGFRNRQDDYLFQEELEKYQKAGILTRLSLATSREPNSGHVRYVQDAIKEHSKELYSLMMDEPGACLYLCGDELTMVKAVNTALLEMIVDNGNLEEQKTAEIRMKQWCTEGRIIRDIWI